MKANVLILINLRHNLKFRKLKSMTIIMFTTENTVKLYPFQTVHVKRKIKLIQIFKFTTIIEYGKTITDKDHPIQ